MRVLVTGGAGYVGSHVVRALLEAGHDPVVYDNLSTGHAESVTEAPLTVGDIRDQERLANTLRRAPCDGVIHLAAVSLVGESMGDPSRYFHNNVVGSVVLFDTLIRCDVPWLVLSSTAAVYGEPESVPIDEGHATTPTNPYGESKRMLEQMLTWYQRAYGFRSVVYRYFNAAGAHPDGTIGEDHRPESHLIPTVLQAALGQRAGVDIYGADFPTPDGTAVRDYVHVCDLARAHVLAAERLHAGKSGGTYNLGSQRGYSVREIIDEARAVTGREVPVRIAARREGDPAVLVAGVDKVRQALGWQPRLQLREMMETAWQWHRTHPFGY